MQPQPPLPRLDDGERRKAPRVVLPAVVSEYLTEDAVQQAFVPGTHLGYFQAHGEIHFST